MPIYTLLWISRILFLSPEWFKTVFGAQMYGIKRLFTLGRLLEIPRCIEFDNSRQLFSAIYKYRVMEYPYLKSIFPKYFRLIQIKKLTLKALQEIN